MRLVMPPSSPRGSVGSMCADDADVLAVEVEPDGGHLWAAVRHDGGEIGDAPQAGDPIQYDALRIEHDESDVEIVVYNRAVLLLRTDSQGASDLHRNSHAARLILCGNEVVLARSVELK